MRKILSVVLVITAVMLSVSAQTKADRERLQRHLEARNVATNDVQVMEAVDEASYPHTSYSYPVEDFKPGVVRVGPRTTYLKEGLRTDEVVKLLGKPVSISERNDDGIIITIYAFQRGEGRILIAEFVGGVLVRTRTESHEQQVVQVDR